MQHKRRAERGTRNWLGTLLRDSLCHWEGGRDENNKRRDEKKTRSGSRNKGRKEKE